MLNNCSEAIQLKVADEHTCIHITIHVSTVRTVSIIILNVCSRVKCVSNLASYSASTSRLDVFLCKTPARV